MCPMLKYSDIYDIWEPITIVIFNESLQNFCIHTPGTPDKNVTYVNDVMPRQTHLYELCVYVCVCMCVCESVKATTASQVYNLEKFILFYNNILSVMIAYKNCI